jgi:hypothetical protein
MSSISWKTLHLYGTIPFSMAILLQIALVVTPSIFNDNTEVPFTTAISSEELTAGVYPESFQKPDGNLPQGTIAEFLAQFAKIILAITSMILLGVFLTAGTFFIIYFNNDEQLKNAKTLLQYGFIGVVIVAIAYAAVEGVSQLTFERRTIPK